MMCWHFVSFRVLFVEPDPPAFAILKIVLDVHSGDDDRPNLMQPVSAFAAPGEKAARRTRVGTACIPVANVRSEELEESLRCLWAGVGDHLRHSNRGPPYGCDRGVLIDCRIPMIR